MKSSDALAAKSLSTDRQDESGLRARSWMNPAPSSPRAALAFSTLETTVWLRERMSGIFEWTRNKIFRGLAPLSE